MLQAISSDRLFRPPQAALDGNSSVKHGQCEGRGSARARCHASLVFIFQEVVDKPLHGRRRGWDRIQEGYGSSVLTAHKRTGVLGQEVMANVSKYSLQVWNLRGISEKE